MVSSVRGAPITQGTKSSITGQYFDADQPFALPRYGNTCVHFQNGRDYLQAVAEAIRTAKSFVMITDWQLDYDVELDNRGHPEHIGRLSEILSQAVKRGVHVRVMLFDALNAVVNTHEEEAQKAFGTIANSSGSIEVMLQNPNTGKSNLGSYDFSGGIKPIVKYANQFFSHHQKSVVVDGRIAFLGGIDLAYGRWDTNAFDVVIDPTIHVLNDAYNAQLVPARRLSDAEVLLTKPRGGRPGFHPSYGPDGKVFDESFQPRQPWQDVAIKVVGPAAFDVFRNFVLRWNSFVGGGTNFADAGLNVDWFTKAQGPAYLVDPLVPGAGTSCVQICRSASSAQLRDELVLWDDKHKFIHDDWKSPDQLRESVAHIARKEWSSRHQTSILDAMVNSIRAAQGFIYIENQFFMSDCGRDQFGVKCPSDNPIIAELANAIGRAIYAGRPFHVWLVLPEHPEGKLEEASTASQAWWALQGVKRASGSLIHRINATILAKNGKAWGVLRTPPSNAEVERILRSHGMDEEWTKYLTVLNLRNYGLTKTHVLSEMIYVHSKLMIVDDAVAIIGSANINDRSLNGNGDTELAAVIVDSAGAALTDVGAGVKLVTRKFARELRIGQWKKHLGMLVDTKTTGAQLERSAPNSIDLNRPLEQASVRGLQMLGRDNRTAYNEVFLHTPRDSYKLLTEGRKLAYSTKRGDKKVDFSLPPELQAAYMTKKKIHLALPGVVEGPGQIHNDIEISVHNVDLAARVLRSRVRGFFVSMPLDWGAGEKATPIAPLAPSMIAVNDASDAQRTG
ncbi:MAG: phospholipase D-like domain-containing protein [Gammaproteobacteria bacterium]